jgi:DNA-binding SARP family transcriptional activator
MQLRISLFGAMKIGFDALPEEVRLTRTTQELLAYLLLNNRRSHPREVIHGMFWGDYPEERARNCLNTAFWRLRQALEPKGVPRGAYLETNHLGEIRFNPRSDYWLDVEQFLQQANGVLAKATNAVTEAEVQALREVLALYQGPLLEGFFSNWVMHQREHIHMTFLNALQYLMTYYQERGRYEDSLVHAQKILEFDPLREEVHRQIMRLYFDLGQRALAIRQYELCRAALSNALDLQPMPETENLYRRLLTGDPASPPVGAPPLPAPRGPAGALALDPLAEQMQLAQRALAHFKEQFQTALEILESLRQ